MIPDIAWITMTVVAMLMGLTVIVYNVSSLIKSIRYLKKKKLEKRTTKQQGEDTI